MTLEALPESPTANRDNIIKAINRERLTQTHSIQAVWPDFYDDCAKAVAFESGRDELVLSINRLTNVRLNKIVSMAALSKLPDDLYQKLATPERELYDSLHLAVEYYRRCIARKIQNGE